MADSSVDRHIVDEIRQAYEGSAQGWANGPAVVYRRLADALVGAAPVSLSGCRVLDLGAGTGVASAALTAVGAHPVGLDLAVDMLVHEQAQRPPGVAGDAQALPFGDAVFDAVVAAFSLNHVPDPPVVLGQCRRVTRSGGLVLASTWPNDADHPAKAAVEAVLERFGYLRPHWYQMFKDQIAARTGDAEVLKRDAVAAGLAEAYVNRTDVEVGLDRPDLAVAWRLNMPHTIGFVAGLDAVERTALCAQAVAALPPDMPSSAPMLSLCARVP